MRDFGLILLFLAFVVALFSREINESLNNYLGSLELSSYPSVEMLNTREEEKAEAYQDGVDEGRRSAISEAISLIEEMR